MNAQEVLYLTPPHISPVIGTHIPMWMTELLLGRLVQLPSCALNTTAYSSPQRRSVQVQEVVLVRHCWVWPSSPVATTLYVSAPSLGAQLTEPTLTSHCTEVLTSRGTHGAGVREAGGELKNTQVCDRSCASCVTWCKIEDHTSSEGGRAAGAAETLAASSLDSDIVVLSTWQSGCQKGLACIVDLQISEAPTGRHNVIHNTTCLVPGDVHHLALTERLSRYNDRLAGL